jgi:hypothetical protein
MHDHCVSAFEGLIRAQYDSTEKQKDLLREAIIDIRVLTNLADTAQSSGVITLSEHEQLTKIIAETNELLQRDIKKSENKLSNV